MVQVLVGCRYRHFKGGVYEVILCALHTETNEVLVIYEDVKHGKIYARPVDMFLEQVEVDGVMKDRFELVNDEDIWSIFI